MCAINFLMAILSGAMRILAGLLTPLIAAIALFIAYWQYRLQEYRVRLDLYDRRIVIYEAIMQFLSGVSQKGTASNEELISLLRDTRQAKFLFKGEIERHINSIYDKALNLQYIRKQLDNEYLPRGPERDSLATQMSLHFKWLSEQYKKTDEMFLKYVKLDR
jgi:hypothetical protein